MGQRRRVSGATLIEILIAVTFLAICAAVILQTVTASSGNSSYAFRRQQVLSALQSRIETVRGTSNSSSITAGTSSTNVAVPGIAEPVTLVTTIASRETSLTLWDVTVTGTWPEQRGSRVWNDSATLRTVVRER